MRLNWHDIKDYKVRPDLFALEWTCSHVHGSLYQFNENEYAIAPYQTNEQGDWGNYVSRFLWATNNHCIRGLILATPSPEEIPRLKPPQDLLLNHECCLFENILEAANSGQFGPNSKGPYGLSASIHEVCYLISVGRYDYYFSAGVGDWNGQTPVMISWHTSDRRWMRLGNPQGE